MNNLSDGLSIFSKVYYVTTATLGLIFNILNIFILTRSRMIKHSSSVFLLGVSVADLLTVLFQIIFKYIVYGILKVRTPEWFFVFLCVYNHWLIVAMIRSSFFILLSFTILRYVSIKYSVKGRMWGKPKTAKVS